MATPSINPAWIAIVLSILLAVAAGAGHVINYILESDTLTRAQIEEIVREERGEIDRSVATIATQHDRDRSDIKASVAAVDSRVDGASAAISNLQASISGINVHIETIGDDLREVKDILNQLLDYQLRSVARASP